jgi:4-diphosphocytidyl-2-C-methyl-D-erythritol kinase
MLNDHFKLNLVKQQLLDLALTLGSDCPFFLYNQACHASGRGELLSPVSIDLTGYALMLVLPGIHVSTAAAFSEMKPAQHNHSTKDIIELPVSEWKHHLFNDFEETVFTIHPVLGELKQSLYDAGAIYCSMSGSGSTLYALVDRQILNEFKERIKQYPRFDHLETYYT